MSYKKYNNYQKYNKQEAIALGYELGKDSAPRVLATGKGVIAEKIIQKAKDHNIPIKKDEELIKILSLLEIDEVIPLEAYSAVAEILSAIYKYNNNMRAKK